MDLQNRKNVISRRQFWSAAGFRSLGLLAILASCKSPITSEEPLSQTAAPKIPVNTPSTVFTVDFGTKGPEVPLLIAFPDCRKRPSSSACAARPVLVRTMKFGEPGGPSVKVGFSNGEELDLQSAAPQRANGTSSISRAAVVRKSTVAWTLDWIFKAARPRIQPDFLNRIRQDFHSLQEEQALSSIPIRAVATLYEEVQRSNNIRSIKWTGASSFALEADSK